MIVLYNPRSTPSDRPPLPLSLLSIGSMLEPQHPFTIVDGNLESDPVARILMLGRQSPLAAVAMTVMPGPQLERAVPDARAIKRALPGVPVIWGGYFPSQHADVCLRDPAVDVCVHSQGEVTFSELADRLSAGGSLEGIPGVSYRDDSGAIRHNPHRPLVDLETLPDLPYDSVAMDRYLQPQYLGRRVGGHQSSFGCPFGCSFCAVVGMVNRRWMPQSPERVARAVERLCSGYGADAIQFYDMDFFVSERRTAEIANRLRRLGINWWALGRIDEVSRYSDATWSAMESSGLKMLFCGAESGSPEMLAQMNKGGTVSPDQTLALAARMRQYGVIPEFSFVLGNPPDPVADIEHTLTFIRALKKVNPFTEVILYMYTPVPQAGTLYDTATDMGFRFPETLDGWIGGDWQGFSLRRDPHTPWMHPRLTRRVRDFESVLNAYYPTATDLSLTGLKRAWLKTLGAWRYHLRVYAQPLELRAFHRLAGYRRPETTGF